MSRGRRPPAPVTLTVTDVRAAARHLTTFGYVVLPAAFDARPLADEIDRVLADAHAEYAGISGWHRDTELPARSIGCLTYLEPLTARGGALWVLPGSHHAGYADAIVAADDPHLPGVAVPTSPGDVIVIDERLFHCSKGSGRRRRRQWRVDYLADDAGADAALAEYFATQHSPDWDGGYDVERYPSYGPAWRALDARSDARLAALGAYEAGRVEEEAAARRRAAPS
jgi:hypothetical protein